jgi:hypothetical protein
MRPSLVRVAVLALTAVVSQVDAHAIDLGDIVEIRGYQPPPPVSRSPAASRPAPVDIKGGALRAFLSPYVRVKNEDVVASAFSSASATAVFRSEERAITLMYAACPWETANLGMIAGPPHMLVFVVNAEFVIFQHRDLCRYPPPGFTPRRGP